MLLLALLAGCGGGTPAGGDPGGKRLRALAEDPVFASAPDGATSVDRRETKARYRKPGFSGGGWDGPSVVVAFESAQPAAEVFRFYSARAESAGWRATAKGAFGTDRWAKTFDGDAPATLVLTKLGGTSYRLSGSIAPE